MRIFFSLFYVYRRVTRALYFFFHFDISIEKKRRKKRNVTVGGDTVPLSLYVLSKTTSSAVRYGWTHCDVHFYRMVNVTEKR